MKLSVVIVNYNVKYYLAQCLHSLKHALKGICAEVIVVDNASVDGSVDYLKQVHPWVRYVASDTNLGFSKANNLAIRQSQGEYVLLLNPDTVVGENVLREALAFMDGHPKSGGVGVRMLNSDGTEAMESRRGIPTPAVAFWKMAGLCRRFPTSRRFARYYMSWLPWDRPARIEIMSGAFCLMRKRALDEVGLLDEDFFMYGEDIDLSYRLLKGGWENWFVPADIIHYKGESTHKTSFEYVHVFYNAMLIFMRKHYSHLSRLVIWPLQVAVYFIAMLTLVSAMWSMMKKSLGFARRYDKEFPMLILEGSDKMKQRCRAIAMRKGLNLIDDIRQAGQQVVIRVFDPSETPYADIISMMQQTANERVRLGLYHSDSDIIITQMEIYE